MTHSETMQKYNRKLKPCKPGNARYSYILSILFFALSIPRGINAETSSLDKFDYKGDLFFRGFYLRRDLPVKKQEASVCAQDEYMSYFFPNAAPGVNTPCGETDDFYQTRLRIDASFRPNAYADIAYGIEVGHLTFGRDNPGSTGPGSGGNGNATNIETRQLYLKLHDINDIFSLKAGLFPIGTPHGIVLASSGAGLQGVYDGKYSSFDISYLRKEDNSIYDGDSNGFSDSNFNNIHLGVMSWKFSGLSWLKSDTYAVYRRDDDPTDAGNDGNETSAMGWLGLYLQFRYKKFTLLMHGVYNRGTFKRPFQYYPSLDDRLNFFPDVRYAIDTSLAAGYPLRSKFRTDAGAGEMEISYQFMDTLKITLLAAGASGRPGIEPDGDPVDYRRDQYRPAGSSFQGSDIMLDSSGGYSIFAGGRLTGIVQKGIRLDMDIFQDVSLQTSYYIFDTYRTPTIDYNRFYQLGLDTNKSDNHLGEEWNMKVNWTIMTLLSLEIRAARFDAMRGYKILYDVEYGDEIYELSASLTQKF